ncbi:Uncharacterised protein [uncultured archaeon]|nr:Uncharacterised protein [uncultured archaeon]
MSKKDLVKILTSLPENSALVVERKNGKQTIGILRKEWQESMAGGNSLFWLQEVPTYGFDGGSDEDFDTCVHYEDISKIYLLEKREIYSEKK